jgi:hypothetical protein
MTIVKIKAEYLEANETGEERYELLEDNGDRVMIRFICDLPIRPINTIPSFMIEGV